MTTRTLADYRPQHDDECEAKTCAECGFTIKYHVELGWVEHAYVPRACTCGLDALLRLSETPHQDEQTDDHGAGLIHPPIPDVDGTEPRLSRVCAPPPSARDYQVSLEGATDFDLNHFGGGVERIERRGELLIFQFTNGGRLCVPGAVTYHAPERH